MILVDFSRPPKWNCPLPESDSQVGLANSEMASHDNAQHHSQNVVSRLDLIFI